METTLAADLFAVMVPYLCAFLSLSRGLTVGHLRYRFLEGQGDARKGFRRCRP